MKKLLLVVLLASLAVVSIDYGFSRKTTHNFQCSGKSSDHHDATYRVWFRNSEREFYLDLAKDDFYNDNLILLSRHDVEITTGLFSGIEYRKKYCTGITTSNP